MTTSATITRIEARALSAGPPIQILSLDVPDPFSFEAGQYLEVLHPDGTSIPLSIASPPEHLPRLTLHYRSTQGDRAAERMDELLGGDQLRIRGGAGDVCLRQDDDQPLLLLAGGTGISQALCLAHAQQLRHPQRSVTLLGCADDEADLYYRDLLPAGSGFSAHLIADPARDSGNRALAWLTANAHQWTGDSRIILSGSPPFVYAMTDVLISQGRPEHSLESDVYGWAPR